MVGDVLVDRGHRDEPLVADQSVEQLGVVDHLVLAADLRVFVTQGVETVRAGHDDLLGLRGSGAEHLVEGLDVLLRQHLEQELVACSTCGVTVTGFAFAQDEEVHGGDVEQFGNGLGGLLRTVLVGTGATDPEQVLKALEALDILAVHRDLDVHLVDPLGAVLGVLAPRIALVLQVLEQARELGREVRLDEHLVAAHVDDVVDVLDVDRALFDAGTAVGAAPQGLGVDDRARGAFALADQLALGLVAGGLGDRIELVLQDVSVGVDQTDLVAADVFLAAGEEVGRLGVTVVAQ